jgi:NAD(P)H-dependent flavin oxidoreductase YrpB (nitropropane dioxygenase family)
MLVAAGGLSSAQDVVRALKLPKCDGVVMGTTFAATIESLYSDRHKFVASIPIIQATKRN